MVWILSLAFLACGERTLPLESEMDPFLPCTSGEGKTYYVRVDGGDTNECTGRRDAPYDGEGTGEECAYTHPAMALASNTSSDFSSGDTLIISVGEYDVGEMDDGTFIDSLVIQSGEGEDQPTCILGAGWNDGCVSPPVLVGVGFPSEILNLTYVTDVRIGCLEITDDEACAPDHPEPAYACDPDRREIKRHRGPSRSPVMLGAIDGIYGFQASGVSLRDLHIHGLTRFGILGAALHDWTMENVIVNTNGYGGIYVAPEGMEDCLALMWEYDVCIETEPYPEDCDDLLDEVDECFETLDASSWGEMVIRESTFSHNGCIEQYGDPIACFGSPDDEDDYAIGSGITVDWTEAEWTVETTRVTHNTGNGILIDIADEHADAFISRTAIEANAGAQLALGGEGVLSNSILIAACAEFEDHEYVTPCQFGGPGVLLIGDFYDDLAIVNSTVWGYGDAMIIASESDWEDHFDERSLKIINSVFVGETRENGPGLPDLIAFSDDFELHLEHNAFFNLSPESENYCELFSENICVDPLFGEYVPGEDDFMAFEVHEGSPLIDAGRPVGFEDLVPEQDFLGNARPEGEGVDIGAFELLLD